MTPGMRIRAKRKELGLKQGQLAKLAGISQPALCELEKGDTKMPNAESLMGLAKALNVTQAWIITGKDSAFGISQPALCELEKGDTKMPNAESLMGLAKALNVTQAWIITGKDGEIEQISQDEESMVRAIRTLTAEQQRAIYQIIDSMKKTE